MAKDPPDGAWLWGWPGATDVPWRAVAGLARRRGKKKAAVAVGRSILVVAHHILRGGAPHHGLGPEHSDRLATDRLTRHCIQRLEQLGHRVTLDPAPQPA